MLAILGATMRVGMALGTLVLCALVAGGPKPSAAQERPASAAKDRRLGDQPTVAFAIALEIGVGAQAAHEVAQSLANQATDQLCLAAVVADDAAIPGTCTSSPSCIRNLAKRQSAAQVALLTVAKAGGVVRLDAQLFSGKTGARMARMQVEYEANDSKSFDEASALLFGKLFFGRAQLCRAARERAKATPKTTPETTPKVPAARREVPLAGSAAGLEHARPPGARGLETAPAQPQRDDTGRRWWLWGGAAAAIAVSAAVILLATSGGSEPDGPVLELPPP